MRPTSLRLLVALEEVDHEDLEVVSLDLHGCREVASTSPSRCRAWWVFAVHDPWVLGQTPPCRTGTLAGSSSIQPYETLTCTVVEIAHWVVDILQDLWAVPR